MKRLSKTRKDWSNSTGWYPSWVQGSRGISGWSDYWQKMFWQQADGEVDQKAQPYQGLPP